MKTTHSDRSKAPTGGRLKGLVPTITCLIMAMTLFIAGCSHPLAIKNIEQYHTFGDNSLDKPTAIGIISNYARPEDQKLLNGIASSLGSHSAKVIMPYTSGNKGDADVVATIAIRSTYEGSATNFWINFPGFLVWAPAWNGYIYEVNHTVDVKLTNAGGQQFAAFAVPVKLDVRHADINRTWTELSWLEFGIIALVGGIHFTNYDESVTPLLASAIQQPVGNYISQEIIKRINDHLNVIKASSVYPPYEN